MVASVGEFWVSVRSLCFGLALGFVLVVGFWALFGCFGCVVRVLGFGF